MVTAHRQFFGIFGDAAPVALAALELEHVEGAGGASPGVGHGLLAEVLHRYAAPMGDEKLIETTISAVPEGGHLMLGPFMGDEIWIEVVSAKEFEAAFQAIPLTESGRGYVQYLPPPRRPLHTLDEQMSCWILAPS